MIRSFIRYKKAGTACFSDSYLPKSPSRSSTLKIGRVDRPQIPEDLHVRIGQTYAGFLFRPVGIADRDRDLHPLRRSFALDPADKRRNFRMILRKSFPGLLQFEKHS